MPTKLRYRPIQYIDDLLKDERRNIGVIAYWDEGIFVKLIGVQKDNSLDLHAFEKISKLAKYNSWVFAEWIDWFRSLAEEYQNNYQDMLPILDKLAEDGSPFITGNEGEIELQQNQLIHEAFDWLSKRILPKIKVSAKKDFDFELALNKFIHEEELIFQEDLEKNIEIEFMPADGNPVTISADYALMDEPKSIFKVLEVKGSKRQMTNKTIEAIYTFEKAIEHGFVTKDRCFLITNREPKPEFMELVTSSLQGLARIIDLSAGPLNFYLYED